MAFPYSELSSYYIASRKGKGSHSSSLWGVREMEEQAAEKKDLGGESGSKSCSGPAGMITRC